MKNKFILLQWHKMARDVLRLSTAVLNSPVQAHHNIITKIGISRLEILISVRKSEQHGKSGTSWV